MRTWSRFFFAIVFLWQGVSQWISFQSLQDSDKELLDKMHSFGTKQQNFESQLHSNQEMLKTLQNQMDDVLQRVEASLDIQSVKILCKNPTMKGMTAVHCARRRLSGL